MKFIGKPPIWQWWDKDFESAPPLLRFAVHSVKAHNPTAIMIEGWHFYDDVSALKPYHQADLVRSQLLARFGGGWLDTDYLCWAPIYDLINHDKFNIWRRPDGELDNDFMFAPPQSAVARRFASEATLLAKHYEFDTARFPEHTLIGGLLLSDLTKELPAGSFHEVSMPLMSPYRHMTQNLDSYCDCPFEPDAGSRGMMMIYSGLKKYIDMETSVALLMDQETVLGSILRHVSASLPTPFIE